MKKPNLSTLLQMRLLVGFLGEATHFGWWPTSFHEESSLLFLKPVFSKTTKLAQYHGVLEAARRLHDEHLSVGSYHLFRLPEEIEQDLHNQMQYPETDEFARHKMCSKDVALGHLKELAGGVSVEGIGPIATGSISELKSPNTIKAIAAAYASAFMRETKAYPYLVSQP